MSESEEDLQGEIALAVAHRFLHERYDAVEKLIKQREQSIREEAENDLLYQLYYAADHNGLSEGIILKEIEARGLTRHHVEPSHSTNKSLEEKK